MWRLLRDVRSGERSRFLFFAGLFTLITLGQTLGLAGSEALFLAELGADKLPITFILAAAATIVMSILYAVRVGVVRNDVLFLHMLLLSGSLLVAAWFGLEAFKWWILPALVCGWYAMQSIFLNHFWTFCGDYFDTIASKRLVPLFTIGSSFGGLLGGLLALGLIRFVGPASLIAAWGIVLMLSAVLLRVFRRPLRRWGPLELEEADETSLENMVAATKYIGSSALARWLVLSALGMVMTFFLAQYLYSDIFVTHFPEPDELATFLALYFVVTNLIEIAFEVAFTPWLIRYVGVPGGNLIHPLLMILGFGGLAFRYGVVAGVAARAGRELMDNAMAAPIRSLMQNAIPQRFRGRVRAFLEGMVVYAGMAVAGLVLLLVKTPDPTVLCGIGTMAALLYLFANSRARRAYLDTLVDQLRAGHLDVRDVGDALGNWEASRLADLWEAALQEAGQQPSTSVLQLIPMLATRGVIDPLIRAASHPSADVRRASVNALASVGDARVAGPLALAMDDPDPDVRLAALRGIVRAEADPAFLEPRIADLLRDLDPRVRAEAALHAGDPGIEILEKMIGSVHVTEATVALRVAPPELIDAAMERCTAENPDIRAAALECLARVSTTRPLDVEQLDQILADPNPQVRRAAALLLANLDDDASHKKLASLLNDSSIDIQLTAERLLVSIGSDALLAVDPYLDADLERTVETALRIVSKIRSSETRSMLSHELRKHVRSLWYAVIAYQRLPEFDGVAGQFLLEAFRDAMLRERRLAFRVLEQLENPTIIRKVDRELRIGSLRSRANALEVLSNLGDRLAARLLALVHEPADLSDRVRAVLEIVRVPVTGEEIVRESRHSDNRWLQLASRGVDPQEGDGPSEEERMQRLLALKQVSLFAQLSLDQLDAIHQATQEAEYLPGEVIIREGDRGDKLYVLLEGEVAIIKNHGTPSEHRLATMTSSDFIGEMAILDDAPRSATAVAVAPSKLLTLDGMSLKELIRQMPEIAFAIFPVLTHRVRDAERRLS